MLENVAKIQRVVLACGAVDLIKLQQEDGKSYSSIHTIRGVLRPAFQMALDDDGNPLVAMHWQHRFNRMVGRYNDI